MKAKSPEEVDAALKRLDGMIGGSTARAQAVDRAARAHPQADAERLSAATPIRDPRAEAPVLWWFRRESRVRKKSRARCTVECDTILVASRLFPSRRIRVVRRGVRVVLPSVFFSALPLSPSEPSAPSASARFGRGSFLERGALDALSLAQEVDATGGDLASRSWGRMASMRAMRHEDGRGEVADEVGRPRERRPRTPRGRASSPPERRTTPWIRPRGRRTTRGCLAPCW